MATLTGFTKVNHWVEKNISENFTIVYSDECGSVGIEVHRFGTARSGPHAGERVKSSETVWLTNDEFNDFFVSMVAIKDSYSLKNWGNYGIR